MLYNKKERIDELFKSERMDIKKDFGMTIKSESIKFKTDISYLLKYILSAKYSEEDGSKKCPAVIPSSFNSAEDYFESFMPSFMEECSAKMRESLN
jgi:hypothetical protein